MKPINFSEFKEDLLEQLAYQKFIDSYQKELKPYGITASSVLKRINALSRFCVVLGDMKYEGGYGHLEFMVEPTSNVLIEETRKYLKEHFLANEFEFSENYCTKYNHEDNESSYYVTFMIKFPTSDIGYFFHNVNNFCYHAEVYEGCVTQLMKTLSGLAKAGEELLNDLASDLEEAYKESDES